MHRDDGYILYVVVVMKKFIEEYVKAAAAKKFIARLDFEINSEQQAQEAEALSKLESDVKINGYSIVVFKYFIHILL